MKKLLEAINLLSVLSVLLAGSSCSDEDFFPGSGEYPEGNATVTMQLQFEPFAASVPAVRGVSGGEAGNLMKEFDDLCIVAYNLEGNMVDGFPVEITKEMHGLEVDSVERKKEDASNGDKPDGNIAEKWTMRATFKLSVPYGKYYIYGVANLGQDRNGVKTTTLQELEKFKGKKREELLNMALAWDEGNFLNNRQMLGYFTDGVEEGSPCTNQNTNEKTVSISRAGMTLHSWLRRCASKVTIDFDGSGLRDNVTVYIKRATIHDIPKSCLLGMPNRVIREEDLLSYKDENYRPDGTDGKAAIEYGHGTDPQAWPHLSNGAPYLTDDNGDRLNLHSEYANALYLYENMQDEQGEKDNKTQRPTPEGTVIGADEKKDEVPCGSYIEVEAYYERISREEVSKGKIIYRFMLGKDELNNFDVERNHHYKITMRLRGNGNDVDWHIEYMEETGFEFHDPYYISYLYNHSSTLRFRYTPPAGRTVKAVKAEIIGNNWWPEGVPDTDIAGTQKNGQRTLISFDMDPMDIKSYRAYDNNYKKENTYPNNYQVEKLRGKTKYLGNGFLSLRATKEATVITWDNTKIKGNSYSQDETFMNDRYFYGDGQGKILGTQTDIPKINRCEREYHFDNTPDETNTGEESYEIKKQPGSNALMINLPVFTRAKNLVKQTGYTGNNLYELSERMAYVLITVTLDNGEEKSKILRCAQVPRITNPKGIYRRAGNNESFHVVLTRLRQDMTSYESFKSDGPWMAEVLGDPDFITLNGRNMIRGRADTPIDFNVLFNRLNRGGTPRNAIIRVRYHNYSCVHLIFVRQGYDPMALRQGGTIWHTRNWVLAGQEGDDPRDEGSLFKYGDRDYPIDVSSNTYGVYEQGRVYPRIDEFVEAGVLNKAIGKNPGEYTSGAMKWSDFKGKENGYQNDNVAEMNDFKELYRTPEIEAGFGVLYADGATETQYRLKDVLDYCRHDSDTRKRGMFGAFFYYWDKEDIDDPYNYRNVFFPIGRSGYGHRKYAEERGEKPNTTWYHGVLRYSAGQVGILKSAWVSNLMDYAPLFYDLYRRKGAVYWSRVQTGVDDATGTWQGNTAGLDLNAFNFDINCIDTSNLYHDRGGDKVYGWDACFVRCVGD